jgi:DNA-directed RNA polymerase subunit RPC12/RpoP
MKKETEMKYIPTSNAGNTPCKNKQCEKYSGAYCKVMANSFIHNCKGYIPEGEEPKPITPTADELKQMLDDGKLMHLIASDCGNYLFKYKGAYYYHYADTKENEYCADPWIEMWANGEYEWEEHTPPQEEHIKTCGNCDDFNKSCFSSSDELAKDCPRWKELQEEQQEPEQTAKLISSIYTCSSCKSHIQSSVPSTIDHCPYCGVVFKQEQTPVEWEKDVLLYSGDTKRENAIKSVVNNNADGIEDLYSRIAYLEKEIGFLKDSLIHKAEDIAEIMKCLPESDEQNEL